jgi:hypothetical protein
MNHSPTDLETDNFSMGIGHCKRLGFVPTKRQSRDIRES